MGVVHPTAPIDERLEKVIATFEIPQQKLNELYGLFCRYDKDGSGYVSMEDMFGSILKLRRNALTDSTIQFLNFRSDQYVTFSEFAQLVWTFGCFEQQELMRYFFFILDHKGRGLLDKYELKHFLINLWHNEQNANFQAALDYLESLDDGDGEFNFREICTLQRHYPNVFYPLYLLQIQIIKNTYGEAWWEQHKRKMIEEKLERNLQEGATLEREARKQQKAEHLAKEEIVKQRMGIRYYLMFWRRSQERERLMKIAAIEAEIDKHVLLNSKVGSQAR